MLGAPLSRADLRDDPVRARAGANAVHCAPQPSALDTASLVPANWGRAKVLQMQDTGWLRANGRTRSLTLCRRPQKRALTRSLCDLTRFANWAGVKRPAALTPQTGSRPGGANMKLRRAAVSIVCSFCPRAGLVIRAKQLFAAAVAIFQAGEDLHHTVFWRTNGTTTATTATKMQTSTRRRSSPSN